MSIHCFLMESLTSDQFGFQVKVSPNCRLGKKYAKWHTFVLLVHETSCHKSAPEKTEGHHFTMPVRCPCPFSSSSSVHSQWRKGSAASLFSDSELSSWPLILKPRSADRRTAPSRELALKAQLLDENSIEFRVEVGRQIKVTNTNCQWPGSYQNYYSGCPKHLVSFIRDGL